MVLEEVSALSAKETEVEEIAALLTVLRTVVIEYWRISPELRAEESGVDGEAVAVMVMNQWSCLLNRWRWNRWKRWWWKAVSMTMA